MYFYFLLFVDINVYKNLIIVVGIIFLGNDNVCVLETFIVEITFD